jgi:hypothetical protein
VFDVDPLQGKIVQPRPISVSVFGNENIFTFLAHLAKGNVSFCHHLASVVR